MATPTWEAALDAMIAAADEVAGTINPIDAYELAIDALLKEGA
ncbi:hypothetical protein [Sphingobium sp. CFD-2]|nr:hypothetical protein [Sphingobium sp. CFD-2]